MNKNNQSDNSQKDIQEMSLLLALTPVVVLISLLSYNVYVYGDGKLVFETGEDTFVVYDLYSDGMCCSYGEGSYLLAKDDGTVLASGGSFGFSEATDFTL